MKLMTEIINKRLSLSEEAKLEHRYESQVWHFYMVYNLCLNLIGYDDPDIKKKNKLVSNLISNFDFKTYYKLVNFMNRDSEVISMAVNFLEKQKEEGAIFGDYYQPNMLMISVYD